MFSPKVSLHLQAPPSDRKPGPVARSRYDYLKFSFKNGGDIEFEKQVVIAMEVLFSGCIFVE